MNAHGSGGAGNVDVGRRASQGELLEGKGESTCHDLPPVVGVDMPVRMASFGGHAEVITGLTDPGGLASATGLAACSLGNLPAASLRGGPGWPKAIKALLSAKNVQPVLDRR